jgi:hypothetical protein
MPQSPGHTIGPIIWCVLIVICGYFAWVSLAPLFHMREELTQLNLINKSLNEQLRIMSRSNQDCNESKVSEKGVDEVALKRFMDGPRLR